MHESTHDRNQQTVVQCTGCNTILCTSTGGKAKLTEVRPTPSATASFPSLSAYFIC